MMTMMKSRAVEAAGCMTTDDNASSPPSWCIAFVTIAALFSPMIILCFVDFYFLVCAMLFFLFLFHCLLLGVIAADLFVHFTYLTELESLVVNNGYICMWCVRSLTYLTHVLQCFRDWYGTFTLPVELSDILFSLRLYLSIFILPPVFLCGHSSARLLPNLWTR